VGATPWRFKSSHPHTPDVQRKRAHVGCRPCSVCKRRCLSPSVALDVAFGRERNPRRCTRTVFCAMLRSALPPGQPSQGRPDLAPLPLLRPPASAAAGRSRACRDSGIRQRSEQKRARVLRGVKLEPQSAHAWRSCCLPAVAWSEYGGAPGADDPSRRAGRQVQVLARLDVPIRVAEGAASARWMIVGPVGCPICSGAYGRPSRNMRKSLCVSPNSEPPRWQLTARQTQPSRIAVAHAALRSALSANKANGSR
jgi:hypothetical protein